MNDIGEITLQTLENIAKSQERIAISTEAMTEASVSMVNAQQKLIEKLPETPDAETITLPEDVLPAPSPYFVGGGAVAVLHAMDDPQLQDMLVTLKRKVANGETAAELTAAASGLAALQAEVEDREYLKHH